MLFEINEGKLNQPLRVAITGTTTGAGIYEIAEILDCDPVTVRGHILRATTKLRDQLKEEK